MSMIKYGDNKCEGNLYEPLSDPAREQLQNLVNTYGRAFESRSSTGSRDQAVRRTQQVRPGSRVRRQDRSPAGHGRSGGHAGGCAPDVTDVGTRARPGPICSAPSAAFARVCQNAPSTGDGSGRRSIDAYRSHEKKKTKRVDGEDLEKEAFAYRPTDKLSDWKLPIKFSTDEKTKTHIRNAISRWSSTDMPDADEKSKARTRIKAAAKKYGIDVDDDSLSGRAQPPKRAGDGDDDDCLCDCVPCDGGDCEGCDCDACECEGCDCESAVAAAKRKAEHARMRHQLAVAGA